MYVVQTSIQLFAYIVLLRENKPFGKQASINIDLNQYRKRIQRALLYNTPSKR